MQSITQQLEEVREGGEVNMTSRKAVQREAAVLGFHDLVVFAEDHKADWMAQLRQHLGGDDGG